LYPKKSLGLGDIHKIGLLILFVIAFFLILFLIALIIGKVFRLGYDNAVTKPLQQQQEIPKLLSA